jgi:NAD-dependent DNA ligase
MNLECKKLELLEIANAWYNGTDFNPISDLDFDQKELEILQEDPDWDFRQHLDSQGADITHYYPMDKVAKMQETEKSMDEVFNEMNLLEDSSNAPKYDGGGLCLYYTNGILYDAVTRSSQKSGKRQISKVASMAPKVLDDHDIVAIECEVVCTLDKGHGDLSRQAATGLLNSNSLQERCEQELTIIGFKVRFKDGVDKDWVEATKKLPTIRIGNNITFIPTPFNEGSYVGNKFHCTEFSSLIDGIVEFRNGKSLAHKLYFNEKKESEILKIQWGFTPESLKYVPKYVYKSVNVDGTNCGAATAGGTAQLKKMQCGVGAKVEIIKAGLTIPQVKGLVPGTDTSENYSLPHTCGDHLSDEDRLIPGRYCGHPLTMEDDLNGGLYCSNPKCPTQLTSLQAQFGAISGDYNMREFIISEPVKFLSSICKIPRFGGLDKLKDKSNKEAINNFVYDLINGYKHPKMVIERHFHLSGLQTEVLGKLDGVISTLIETNL